MNFKGSVHKRIFIREVARCRAKNIPYYYLAALFLLTSSNSLWQRASKHINPIKINWKAIDIRGVSVQDYALLKLAKDLYQGTTTISYMELCDDRIFSDRTMRLIYSAIDIRRHGMAVFTQKINIKESEDI